MNKLANKLLNLWAESGANVIDDDSDATLTLENTSTGVALAARQTNLSSATVASFRALNSNASGVFLEFVGGVLSTASINQLANQSAGYVRVHFTGAGGDGFGYIPIYKGVV